jgi:hypothetical protein
MQDGKAPNNWDNNHEEAFWWLSELGFQPTEGAIATEPQEDTLS